MGVWHGPLWRPSLQLVARRHHSPLPRQIHLHLFTPWCSPISSLTLSVRVAGFRSHFFGASSLGRCFRSSDVGLLSCFDVVCHSVPAYLAGYVGFACVGVSRSCFPAFGICGLQPRPPLRLQFWAGLALGSQSASSGSSAIHTGGAFIPAAPWLPGLASSA